MKTFLEHRAVLPEIEDVRCNQCGRHIEKDSTGYFEDHISIAKEWGYHSPYDGETHKIDICIPCYQSWTHIFQIPPMREFVEYFWE